MMTGLEVVVAHALTMTETVPVGMVMVIKAARCSKMLLLCDLGSTFWRGGLGVGVDRCRCAHFSAALLTLQCVERGKSAKPARLFARVLWILPTFDRVVAGHMRL